MSSTFRFATNFNQKISEWDVSRVTSLYGTFQAAQKMNQDISSWDISRVRYMNFMLSDALSFRQSWCSEGWQLSSYHSFSDGFNLSTGVGLLCCMRGEYMNGSSCALCEIGMHQRLPYTQMTSCKACQRNHVASTQGAATCRKCPTGRFSNNGRECVMCVPGYHQMNYTELTNCSKCPVGRYQPDESQVTCPGCSEGQYQNEEARQYCLQ